MKRKVCIILACCLGILWGVGAAQANIMAHWTFDEGSGTVAHDSIGGYNGNLSAAGATWSTGISGGAISLTASQGGMVNMGTVLNNLAGTPYTIAAWVNTTVADETSQVVVGSHQSTVVAGYILGVNSSAGGGYGEIGKAWFYNAGTGVISPKSSITVVNTGWHQLVGVRGGGTVSLYVDGVFQASYADQGLGNAPAGTPLLFGGIRQAGSNDLLSYYTGLIDDVQFYNTALSAGEISYLYNHPGQAVPVPPAVWLFGSGLLGLAGWRYRRRKS
jgi:hypothetical protein